MILVTGAAGHIGNVLVRKLFEQGEKVKALILPNEPIDSLKGLKIEKVYGNILNYNDLVKAFQDVDVVYHLAAIISITKKGRKLMDRVNIEGTKNVIRACKKCGVKKLIYTSSIHAFEEPESENDIINEKSSIDPERVIGDYARSKAQATLEVLKANSNELSTLVICPTGVLGPYDFRISEMGQVIIHYIQGKLKAYVNGAYDFVDVRDVAQGLILAAEKGRAGEIYILSGEYISIYKMFKILEELTGIQVPKFKMPMWLVKLTAPLSNLYYGIKKQKPLFTKYTAYTLTSNCNTASKKAQEELGFRARPLKKSIKDSIKWFQENKKLTIEKK